MQPAESRAHEFLTRMLPLLPPASRTEPPPFEPVVALLGARGAGKSALLEAMATECGEKIVHSRLDFAELPPNLFEATVKATTETALLMSRKWPYHRQPPTFHRLGLALIALTAPELPMNPDEARARFGELVRDYVQQTHGGRLAKESESQLGTVADKVTEMAAAHAGVPQLAEPASAVAKQGIAFLLRGLSRRAVRGAADWYAHIPSLGGAELVDALIQLHLFRRQQGVSHLIRALLSDMAAHAHDHPAIAHRCACVLPRGAADRRHPHAWVLLADNADSGAGHAFLTALTEVRSRLATDSRTRDGADPLLVTAAYSTWHTGWAHYWYEPWHIPDAAEVEHGRRTPVPSFTEVAPELWRTQRAVDLGRAEPRAGWYPVVVPYLGETHVLSTVGLLEQQLDLPGLGSLAYQLSAGNTRFVESLVLAAEALPSAGPARSSRPGVLMTTEVTLSRPEPDDRPATGPLWWRSLDDLLPAEAAFPAPVRAWREIPDAVVAAAYLADPDHVHDHTLPSGLTGINPLIGWFKDNLWVSVSHGARPRLRELVDEHAEPQVALHPWLSRCLLAGLALTDVSRPAPDPGGPDPSGADPGGDVSAWDHLFGRLRAELVPPADSPPAASPSSDSPPPTGRSLYYDLALGRFVEVALSLGERFNEMPYEQWLRLLAQATAAPCRLPMAMDQRTALEGLVAQWERDVRRPNPVQTQTAKLLALLWLYNDPLVLALPNWDRQIVSAFGILIANASRPVTDALKNARDRFDRRP